MCIPYFYLVEEILRQLPPVVVLFFGIVAGITISVIVALRYGRKTTPAGPSLDSDRPEQRLNPWQLAVDRVAELQPEDGVSAAAKDEVLTALRERAKPPVVRPDLSVEESETSTVSAARGPSEGVQPPVGAGAAGPTGAGLPPADSTTPTRPTPVPPISPFDDLPEERASRKPLGRSAADVLSTFLEERNIRWGELLAGLLIVISAIGLVVSLHRTIRDLSERIPYLPAGLFLLVTAAMHGAGQYTLRKWRLRTTSRGTLVIALLLIPLNVTAAIILSGTGARRVPTDSPAFWIPLGIGLTVFTWLAWTATRALFRVGTLRLTVGVLVPAFAQVAVNRLLSESWTVTERWHAVGVSVIPLVGLAIAAAWQMRSTARPRAWNRVAFEQWSLASGIMVFAVTLPQVLIAARASDRSMALYVLSPAAGMIGWTLLGLALALRRRLGPAADGAAGAHLVSASVALLGGLLAIASAAIASRVPSLLLVWSCLSLAALVGYAMAASLPRLLTPAVLSGAGLTVALTELWSPSSDAAARWFHTAFDGRRGLWTVIYAGFLSSLLVVIRRMRRPVVGDVERGALWDGVILVYCLAGVLATATVWLSAPGTDPALAALAIVSLATGWCVWNTRSSGAAEGLTIVSILWSSLFCIHWCRAHAGLVSTMVADLPWIPADWLPLGLSLGGLARITGAAVAWELQLHHRLARTPGRRRALAIESTAALGLILGAVVALLIIGGSAGTYLSFPLATLLLLAGIVAHLAGRVAPHHAWRELSAATLLLGGAVAALHIAPDIERGPVWWDRGMRFATGMLVVAAVHAVLRRAGRRLPRLIRTFPAAAAMLQLGVLVAMTALSTLVALAMVPPVAAEFGVRFGRHPVWQSLKHVPIAPAWWAGGALLAGGLTWRRHPRDIVPFPAALCLIGVIILGMAAALMAVPHGAVAVSLAWESLAIVLIGRAVWLHPGMRRLAEQTWNDPLDVIRSIPCLLTAALLISLSFGNHITPIDLPGADGLPAWFPVGNRLTAWLYALPVMFIGIDALWEAGSRRFERRRLAGGIMVTYGALLVMWLLHALGAATAEPVPWSWLPVVAAATAGYWLAWTLLERRRADWDEWPGWQGYGVLAAVLTAGVSIAACRWLAISSRAGMVYLVWASWPSYVAWGGVALASWCSVARRPAWRSTVGLGLATLLVPIGAASLGFIPRIAPWTPSWVLIAGLVVLSGAWSFVPRARITWSIGRVASNLLLVVAAVQVAGLVKAIEMVWGGVPFEAMGGLYTLAALLIAGAALRSGLVLETYWSTLAATLALGVWIEHLPGTRETAAWVLAGVTWYCHLWLIRPRRVSDGGLVDRWRRSAAHVPVGWLFSIGTLFVLGSFTGALFRNAALVAQATWIAPVACLSLGLVSLWGVRFARTASPGVQIGLFLSGWSAVGVVMIAWLHWVPVQADMAEWLAESLGVGLGSCYLVVITYLTARHARRVWARRWGSPFAPSEPVSRPWDVDQATMGWFVSFAGLGLVLLAMTLVVWGTPRSLRLVGVLAPMAVVWSLTNLMSPTNRSAKQRWLLRVIPISAILLSWTDVPAGLAAGDALRRLVRVLIVACVAAFGYGVVVRRQVRTGSPWYTSVLRVAFEWSVCAGVTLTGLLVAELSLFRARQGVPIPLPSAIVVSVALVGLIVAWLTFALRRPDPARSWQLPISFQREWFVYAAEGTGAVLFGHLYMVHPELFRGILQPYWPYIVLAIAYGGVVVAELSRRRGLTVLSDPLFRSGGFLPLLPVIGFWFVRAESTDYTVVLAVVGILYLLVTWTTQSWIAAIAAVAFGNATLWSMWADAGWHFLRYPQIWLIPPAVCVLAAAQWYRDRLARTQLQAIRYGCLIVIYLSSTSELFVWGFEPDWPHLIRPMILMLLSVLGVLTGIGFRVLAFLVVGLGFLFVSMISMVAMASSLTHHTWPWWAFGISLGVAVLILFGIFEKNRSALRAWVETVREWDR